MVQLIELPCDNIIESDPNVDMHQLPSIIRDSVGTEARFYLQTHRNDRNGSTRCTINRLELTNIRPTARLQHQNPRAPITPQQQPTISAHQTSSSAKRQLILHDGRLSINYTLSTISKPTNIFIKTGESSNTNKLPKTTIDNTHNVALEEVIQEHKTTPPDSEAQVQ